MLSRQLYGHFGRKAERDITVNEWLLFHGLSNVECGKYLHKSAPFPVIFDTAPANKGSIQNIRPKEVWDDLCTAFELYFDDVGSNLPVIYSDTNPILKKSYNYGDRAFTLDPGGHELPVVYVPCSEFCSPAEILAIAHEFTHAYQIISSRRFLNG